MPLSAWNKFMKSPLSSNASKSSLALGSASETRGSPVCQESSPKAQATTSESQLDQQQKIRRLRSTPSRLNKSTKSPSNASQDSFYTAGQPSESSEHSNGHAQSADGDDTAQTSASPERDGEDTAKALADRAWNEDSTFVEREKLVEWLGSPNDESQHALTQYMINFDFARVSIDDAIRRLCQKLYIKGETQQIDRVLESFSERYIKQNPDAIWRSTDVVHVVTFAIILLNTDLQASELQAHITNSRFVENTIEAIQSQVHQPNAETVPAQDTFSAPDHLSDIQEVSSLPQTPPTPLPNARASSPPNLERHASRVRDRLGSFGSSPFNRESWIIPVLEPRDSMESSVLDQWIAEIARELSSIYHNVRSRPILQPKSDDSPSSPQSKVGGGLLKRGSAKLYHSLRGESPYAQSSGSPSASGASFVSVLGQRVSSSMSSLPHFLGLTSSPSLPSSTNADLAKSADSPQARSGPLLWKSMKPTPGRIAKPKRWLSVIATVRNSVLDMTSPIPPGANAGTGRRLGTLSLLHALAQEVPAMKGSKVRSFGLTLASGETHMFEIQIAPCGPPSAFKGKSKPSVDANAEVLAWVKACNYHAARYSRAPLPDAVTNVEYGWNGPAEEDDNMSTKGRNVSIDDWVAPTLPPIETHLDASGQLEAWNNQVGTCERELAEHGNTRGRIINLYRPGSIQVQKALANWQARAQFLLTEIVKYKTYAEILKTEHSTKEST